MKLQAWRVVLKSPCEDPPVKIVIGPSEGPPTGFYGWVLPLEAAIEIFGRDEIDRITEEPQQVFLSMVVADLAEK